MDFPLMRRRAHNLISQQFDFHIRLSVRQTLEGWKHKI